MPTPNCYHLFFTFIHNLVRTFSFLDSTIFHSCRKCVTTFILLPQVMVSKLHKKLAATADQKKGTSLHAAIDSRIQVC